MQMDARLGLLFARVINPSASVRKLFEQFARVRSAESACRAGLSAARPAASVYARAACRALFSSFFCNCGHLQHHEERGGNEQIAAALFIYVSARLLSLRDYLRGAFAPSPMEAMESVMAVSAMVFIRNNPSRPGCLGSTAAIARGTSAFGLDDLRKRRSCAAAFHLPLAGNSHRAALLRLGLRNAAVGYGLDPS